MQLLAQGLGTRLLMRLVLGPLQLAQGVPGQASLEPLPARDFPPCQEEALPRELPFHVLGRPTGHETLWNGTTCTSQGLHGENYMVQTPNGSRQAMMSCLPERHGHLCDKFALAVESQRGLDRTNASTGPSVLTRFYGGPEPEKSLPVAVACPTSPLPGRSCCSAGRPKRVLSHVLPSDPTPPACFLIRRTDGAKSRPKAVSLPTEAGNIQRAECLACCQLRPVFQLLTTPWHICFSGFNPQYETYEKLAESDRVER